jgi:cell division protein FtsB
MKTISDRLLMLERSNAKQQEELAELRASNVELRESNDRLEDRIQTTMEAVLGVSDVFQCLFLWTYI